MLSTILDINMDFIPPLKWIVPNTLHCSIQYSTALSLHQFNLTSKSFDPNKSMESHQKRLLARTVDDRAETNPNQRFAIIPQGSEINNGFQDLSIKDLARAVNFMCWWVESTIGQAQFPETLAYTGSNDVRYFIFMLACQKTGYQVRK